MGAMKMECDEVEVLLDPRLVSSSSAGADPRVAAGEPSGRGLSVGRAGRVVGRERSVEESEADGVTLSAGAAHTSLRGMLARALRSGDLPDCGRHAVLVEWEGVGGLTGSRRGMRESKSTQQTTLNACASASPHSVRGQPGGLRTVGIATG